MKTIFLKIQIYTVTDVSFVITITSIQLNWLHCFNMTGIILLFCNLLLE